MMRQSEGERAGRKYTTTEISADERPERACLQRVVEDAAQGEKDVAAPARPTVGRRPLDDLAPRSRRPNAVTRDGNQACPRAPRGARRIRNAALFRSRCLDDKPPDCARGIRAPVRRAPDGAAG